MYQRAAKLAELAAPLEELLQLADMQREAYVIALNALSLLDDKNAWMVVPMTAASSYSGVSGLLGGKLAC
jgi:hypothetical protein